MHKPDNSPKNSPYFDGTPPAEDGDGDFPTTSAEDVESAGRSCLVILVMAVIILALLLIWIVFGITGGAGR